MMRISVNNTFIRANRRSDWMLVTSVRDIWLLRTISVVFDKKNAHYLENWWSDFRAVLDGNVS